MDEKDWQEIRELRKEFMGTSKGIALGNLIAEKQRLDKVRQIVNSEVDLNICNNFGDVRKLQAIRKILEQDN